MAASFVNLTQLSTYTDQISFDIISQAVAGTRIADFSRLYVGNSSGTVAVPLLNNNPVIQPTSGGWTPGGTFSITQVLMAIDDLEIKVTYSPYDFRAYYTSVFLNASGQLEDIPYEKQLVDLFQKQIELYIEYAVFYGDGSSNPYATTGPGNVKGVIFGTTIGNLGSTSIGGTINLPQFTAGTTGTTSNNLSACWTSTVGATSNAINQINAMLNAIPAAVFAMSDLTLYCSISMFQTYILAGVNANLFHYNFGSAGAGTPVSEQYFYHPGTNVKVVPFAGLGTSCHAVLGPKEFLIYAVGLSPDVDYAKIFYDPYNDYVKYIAKWRLGTAIAFPEFWVTNNL